GYHVEIPGCTADPPVFSAVHPRCASVCHGHRPVTLAARPFARGYPSVIPGSPCWQPGSPALQRVSPGARLSIAESATLYRRADPPVSPARRHWLPSRRYWVIASPPWVSGSVPQSFWLPPPGCRL